MPARTKKLLIALFISIIILALSIIFRPFEPEEELPEEAQQEETMNQEGLPEM